MEKFETPSMPEDTNKRATPLKVSTAPTMARTVPMLLRAMPRRYWRQVASGIRLAIPKRDLVHAVANTASPGGTSLGEAPLGCLLRHLHRHRGA